MPVGGRTVSNMVQELTEGHYEIWVCDQCYIPCIFTREPREGDAEYKCWNGYSKIISEPHNMGICGDSPKSGKPVCPVCGQSAIEIVSIHVNNNTTTTGYEELLSQKAKCINGHTWKTGCL